MSVNKNINKICALFTILAVIITVIFMNGSYLGIETIDALAFDYENKIFDDSYVHTIDIKMDDVDSFIDNATKEEYVAADVTIDGETVKNVGVRAKGNTSLSTVSQLDSERYSLKIEFDAFELSRNYYGLDKLCLNNLIQDYTMMKDYIAYKLMNEFGVASPLVSYCFVTINDKDWGLFLAVEAIEDSFLERQYGTSYGQLYKPDTMGMGGGRGNGRDFDMKDVDFEKMGMDNPFENRSNGKEKSDDQSSSDGDDDSDTANKYKDADKDDKDSTGDSPGGNFPGGSFPEGGFPGGDFPEGGFPGGDFPGGFPGGDFSEGGFPGRDFPEGGFPGGFPGGSGGGFPGGGSGGPGGGFPGMGSSDAKLQYIDDDPDSYSTIFNSAKTNTQLSDKKRLIRALKALSEGIENADAEKIESAVNIDEVMRYMVVHNFVVNGDSYTGGMIHNYYLYEEDGLMTMIPWDYNLAYGTFQANDSNSAVNDPIDTPLSVTEGSNDRPMFSWITSTEEFKALYHEYYREFLDQFYTNGYLSDLISRTHDMIAPYVERDPTKFCTTEEFEKGVQTIAKFVSLRCESIEGQLNGTIPSTDSGQKADDSNLVDASDITLSDMGSMGGGGGPGGGPGGGFGRSRNKSGKMIPR